MGLYADAKSIAERDPAAKGVWQVILLYPGFHVLISHRLANWFYRRRLFFIARMISQIARFFTAIEDHLETKIGQKLLLIMARVSLSVRPRRLVTTVPSITM